MYDDRNLSRTSCCEILFQYAKCDGSALSTSRSFGRAFDGRTSKLFDAYGFFEGLPLLMGVSLCSQHEVWIEFPSQVVAIFNGPVGPGLRRDQVSTS